MKGKKILIGITGGIAAYKIPMLVRLLVKAGAEVRVIATSDALEFVSKNTLAVLSNHKVYQAFYNEKGTWDSHVELGLWADVFIVAPLTANTLAKMANGICDNLLLATFLSLRSTAVVFPAMDLDMWEHPSTQQNIKALAQFKVSVVQPAVGSLASGLEGKGRMPEPDAIFDHIKSIFKHSLRWEGKRILITAGPTYENIDPVRFIGNHSSGKMGYAIAQAFINQGAEVDLVSGPTKLLPPEGLRGFHKVNTAEEMLAASEAVFDEANVAIFCAAVSDYKVKQQADQKIKREGKEALSLELVSNPDIAKTLSDQKKKQICCGFSLETEHGVENAKAKLSRKNLDLIILNTLNPEAGVDFGSDTNSVQFIDRNNKLEETGLKNKREIAIDIEKYIFENLL